MKPGSTTIKRGRKRQKGRKTALRARRGIAARGPQQPSPAYGTVAPAPGRTRDPREKWQLTQKSV